MNTVEVIWVKTTVTNEHVGLIGGSSKTFFVDRYEGQWRITRPDGSIGLYETSLELKDEARRWLRENKIN